MHTLLDSLKSYAVPIAIAFLLLGVIWIIVQVKKAKGRNGRQPLFRQEDLTPDPTQVQQPSPPPLPPQSDGRDRALQEALALVAWISRYKKVLFVVGFFVLVLVPMFTLALGYRNLQKANLELRAMRHINNVVVPMKGTIDEMNVECSESEPAAAVPAEIDYRSDQLKRLTADDPCINGCVAKPEWDAEAGMFLEKQVDDVVYQMGECVGPGFCGACRPSGPIGEKDPKKMKCRRLPD